MIVDSMSKMEVMQSLQQELRKEILPFCRILLKDFERTVLPKVQRTGQPQKVIKEKKTSGNNVFHLFFNVTKNGYQMTAYNEFVWRGKRCYANFFDNESVVVFQNHCLERYAERVLNRELSPADVFRKYLMNKQNSAFQIALQSPKRERCQFFGLADALFLGDYDEPTIENKEVNYHWYNTCISLKESHTSQSGILFSLSLMQKFVKGLGFNPLNDEYIISSANRKVLDKYIQESVTNKQAYVDFLKRTYMLHQLQLSLNFPWIKIYLDEINARMSNLSEELKKYNVNTASLSPYGKEGGFAIKGEINYKV